MAGAVKHMERSRRSHRKSDSLYASFHRHAYKVRENKVTKQTLGQKLAGVFAPIKNALRRAKGGSK